MRPTALVAFAGACLVVAGCRGGQPAPNAPAPGREVAPLAGPWRFQGSDDIAAAEQPAFDDAGWETVAVPHTWGSRAWRAAWYRTRIHLSPQDLARRLYLRFEGAAAIAEVFLNGEALGRHVGAYTAFVFDATPHARAGENVLAVRLTNSPQDTADALPSGAARQLYRGYGGIYRRVWLIKAPSLHIDPTDHAAPGVYVTTREVGPASAGLEVRVLLRNGGSERRSARLRVRLLDRAGAEALELRGSATLEPGGASQVILTGRVARPALWSPADPALYRLRAELLEGQNVVDAVEQRAGFRDFRMKDGRYDLNGQAILLRGVGRHQESERHLAAATDEELREDFAQLRDLGVNMVRLAHYPHASLAYDLADELGLLVWAENGHSNPWKVAHPVGDVITREMIRQHYNHPSIVIWSVGNETAYMRIRRYSDVAREEDPSRLVAYASNTGVLPKEQFPNLDLVAHNVYRGWYQGEPWELEGKLLQWRHISENGAGSVVSSHTDYADARHVVDRFEPEEYRQLLAEIQCQVVFRDHRDEIPMYLVWILRDFAIDKYKGRNTKGLLTGGGLRKDAYYLYRSFLRPDAPLVHITSKTYFLRSGRADNGIKAYSNLPRLSLTLNGRAMGEQENGAYHHANGRRIDNVFFWPVALRPGRNEVAVGDGAGHSDSAIVYHAPDGRVGPPEGALIRDLRSSNPAVPAALIEKPVEEQWPFYAEFDGSADNTFDRLPEALRGASWIATPRLSKPNRRTEIAFTAARPAEVFVMTSEGSPLTAKLVEDGFVEAQERGLWRDNDLRLVPFRLFRRQVGEGRRVPVPAATADYVVLLKAAEGAPGS